MNNDALIGFTGFVGSTLLKQRNFEHLYHSKNIEQIKERIFDAVICAGAPGQKWVANQNPGKDKKNIENLIECISAIKCNKFILISTVDVFHNPTNVDENTSINEAGLHAYGLHRRQLEKFVMNTFDDYLIVRLPGLVGPGLKKNVIYDFLNNNNLGSIESRGVFQFYPMVNLWHDIEIALQAKLKLVHLTSKPISVSDIAKEAFNISFKNEIVESPAEYNFKTCKSGVFHCRNNYQYNKKEVLLAIRAYAQSELKARKQ